MIMKGLGIFLVAYGVLGLIGGAMSSAQNDNYSMTGRLFAVSIGIIGVGIYLISKANKKKNEQSKKDKWNNS